MHKKTPEIFLRSFFMPFESSFKDKYQRYFILEGQ